MRAFREVVDECAFQDLGWSGVPFTWDNRQSGVANVKARIDRALANEEFRQQFRFTKVRHISAAESDHCFVLLEFRVQRDDHGRRGARLFRYENVWQTHSDYEKVVSDCWRGQQRTPDLQGISESLTAMQRRLEPWGKKNLAA